MDYQISDEARMSYILRRKKDLRTCEEALKKEDYQTLQTIGHQIKGSAGSYGFDSLTPLANCLEDLAMEKNDEMLKGILVLFADAVNELRL